MNLQDNKPVIHKRTHKYFWPIIVGTLFILFFIMTSTYYVYKLTGANDAVIADQVEKLSDIFKRIHQQTNIMKIEGDRNTIDFLNIKSFAGRQVGPLVLEYPEKWQGPYLTKELKVQGKPYQIIKAKNNYYIVPANGVKLQNGKILGKTLILNNNTNLEIYLNDPDYLMGRSGKPLAAKLEISRTGFDLLVPKDPFAFGADDD